MGRYRKYGFAAAAGLALLAFLCGCAAAPPLKTEASTVPETVRESGSSGETDGSEDTVRISLNQENTEEERETDPARSREEELLESMNLREKVAQMFVVLPEELLSAAESGSAEGKAELLENGAVICVGEAMERAYGEIPVGGFIYMKSNLRDPEQTEALLSGLDAYSKERFGIPAFHCVDEEGGTVARIGGRMEFGAPDVGDMAGIGETGDAEKALEAGRTLGGYLSELGFNVDFAPVADVLTNPDNQVVKRRSFGSDPDLVADMALAVDQGLKESGVLGAFKHFPGHGATEGDTHEGYAFTSKSLDELWDCELLPFRKAAENGVEFIMAGHIALPAVTGDETPASLSEELLTGLLRERIGYEGIIITDAMNMGAIVQTYSSGEAAVKAVAAGADMILMPEGLTSAWEGLLEAVASGTIPEERIDASVRRILQAKLAAD